MAEHCMPPEEMDQRDEATGLRNRVSIEGILSAHLANRRSSSFPFGCLLVEVDYYEDIEEEYGPGVAAEVLKRLGEILAESCRVEDYLAHYTRDQFLVVLPTTNASGTIILGEKLLRNVRNAEYADMPPGRPMTISVGATCVFHGTTLDLADLMDVLEQQLEQAKRTGHNRIVMNTRQTLEQLGRY
jgi:diguanylate cyclase (GGDEF)-like protein